ncbi:hypothetical protein BFP72_05000 [Reichenbachiella sp. 5M10]|uniref:alpha/beta hydrolase n=1 Tax=Reichenbachiella sp. 5M10 TaxID=1889772 RepID=UPI000C14A296|nr:alpha/beta hydrolase [Reichenbachiella sp. 5M10]PIB34806.1 hypothetical protein BFP72_05000 [Reichenbachiella sp. 5M10]
MNTKIYCIPGLGLDAQIFDNLNLGCRPLLFIHWIEPLQEESIQAYAKRLSSILHKEDSDIILIGHSFGGILAQEISCLHNIKLIILISSVKKPKEIPMYMRIISKLKLYKLITKNNLLYSFPLWSASQGYSSSSLKSIFKNSIAKISTSYIQWSFHEIANWKGVENESTPIVQIHGDKDLTFPLQSESPPHKLIHSGDHLMVYKRGKEISDFIQTTLNAT